MDAGQQDILVTLIDVVMGVAVFVVFVAAVVGGLDVARFGLK